MSDARFCVLGDRGLLALVGDDAVPFLQGIVTNDVEALSDDRAIYTALLTPQGKYLHDFFLIRLGETVLVDAPAARFDELKRRLAMYRLRAKVTIEDVTDSYGVYALVGDEACRVAALDGDAGLSCRRNDGAIFIDPRLKALGLRAVFPRAVGTALLKDAGFAEAPRETYDAHRTSLGVPGTMGAEALYPLEAGLDELNGISFTKGCYVGQEVTARMKNRKLVRKRIVPVAIDGAVETGSQIRLGDATVGEVFTGGTDTGLALIRLESLQSILEDNRKLTSGDATLTPYRPDWVNF